MQLLKLAILLSASFLFFGCISRPRQTQSSPTPSETPPTITINSSTLKEAIKELEVLKDKVDGGIDDRGYSVIITKTSPLVQKASGEAKAVAAVKSAFEGHQLALKFWQCDRLEGYEKLRQCQGNALAGIFTKYPDIKAQVKSAAKGEEVSTISGGLDKEGILQAVWKKTSADTEAASQAIAPDPAQKQPQP